MATPRSRQPVTSLPLCVRVCVEGGFTGPWLRTGLLQKILKAITFDTMEGHSRAHAHT